MQHPKPRPQKTEYKEAEDKNTFSEMLAEYVKKHGADSPELVKLASLHEVEQKEQKHAQLTKKRQMTRRAALQTLGGIIGTAAVGVAAGYLSKEAAEKAAEEAAEKRINAIQEDFKKWQQKFAETAFKLMDEMFKFIKLFQKTERWMSAGNAAVHGVIGDITDYFLNQDKKPDHIKKSFEKMIQDDPALAKSYNSIHQLSEQLKNHIENFGQIVNETADWKKQRDQFMKDFFESFTQNLLPE